MSTFSGIFSKPEAGSVQITFAPHTHNTLRTSEVVQMLGRIARNNLEHGVWGERQFIFCIHHTQQTDVFCVDGPDLYKSYPVTVSGGAEPQQRDLLIGCCTCDCIPANLQDKNIRNGISRLNSNMYISNFAHQAAFLIQMTHLSKPQVQTTKHITLNRGQLLES